MSHFRSLQFKVVLKKLQLHRVRSAWCHLMSWLHTLAVLQHFASHCQEAVCHDIIREDLVHHGERGLLAPLLLNKHTWSLHMSTVCLDMPCACKPSWNLVKGSLCTTKIYGPISQGFSTAFPYLSLLIFSFSDSPCKVQPFPSQVHKSAGSWRVCSLMSRHPDEHQTDSGLNQSLCVITLSLQLLNQTLFERLFNFFCFKSSVCGKSEVFRSCLAESHSQTMLLYQPPWFRVAMAASSGP